MIEFMVPTPFSRKKFDKYLDLSFAKNHYTNFGPCEQLLKEKLATKTGCEHVVCAANATLILDGLHRMLAHLETVYLPSFTFPATNQGCLLTDGKGVEKVWYSKTGDGRSNMAMAIHPDSHVGYAITVNPFGSDNCCDRPNCDFWIVDNAAGTLESVREWLIKGADAVILSLHATKILSACEGGVAFFKDQKSQREYLDYTNFNFRQNADGSRTTLSIGSNHKMSELSAAVCLANLEAYDCQIADREMTADRYLDCCLENSIRFIYSLQAFWVLGKISNLEIQRLCKEWGIDVRPYYARLANYNRECLVTEELIDKGFCLPTRKLEGKELNSVVKILEHLKNKNMV